MPSHITYDNEVYEIQNFELDYTIRDIDTSFTINKAEKFCEIAYELAKNNERFNIEISVERIEENDGQSNIVFNTISLEKCKVVDIINRFSFRNLEIHIKS